MERAGPSEQWGDAAFRTAPGFTYDEMKTTRETARRILKVRSSNRK